MICGWLLVPLIELLLCSCNVLQCIAPGVKTVMYDWLMVGFHLRDGLRFVTMMSGGQFVTTAGEMLMLQLFALSWGTAQKVCGKQATSTRMHAQHRHRMTSARVW